MFELSAIGSAISMSDGYRLLLQSGYRRVITRKKRSYCQFASFFNQTFKYLLEHMTFNDNVRKYLRVRVFIYILLRVSKKYGFLGIA